MRRYLAAAVLVPLCAAVTPTAAAVDFHATRFDISDLGENSHDQLVGDTFIWNSGFNVAFTYSQTGTGSWSDSTHLTWAAHTGLQITGFTVVYDLLFDGTSYLIQGGERDVDFGGLRPGDTWFSTAEFTTTSGTPTLFKGGGSVEQLVTHQTSGDQFNATFTLLAHGLAEFCPPTNDPLLCGFVLGLTLPTRLELKSISITPNIVAIPEPATTALLLIGLAGLIKRCGPRRRG